MCIRDSTILMDFICLLIIPDLNPVDSKIWSVVQQQVYQSQVHNVDEFKQRLVHVWHGIDQTIIDNVALCHSGRQGDAQAQKPLNAMRKSRGSVSHS